MALALLWLAGCYGLAPYASYRPDPVIGGDDTDTTDGGTTDTVQNEGCPLGDDDDDDRVCDEDDICPGGDDREDADNDGVPDDCDFCPEDPDDDSDGDGICDSDDICPGSNDNSDRDSDGVPNGCDVCPDDPQNDPDGDGICESVDPCPGNAQNNCSHQLELDIYTDSWPEEISWDITANGTMLDSGWFGYYDYGFVNVYSASVGDYVCVDMYDSFGDGGSSGGVYDYTNSQTMMTWVGSDYQYQGQFCFTVAP